MALTMACFSSAQILQVILSAVTTERTDLKYHFQAILDAAKYLDTTRNAIAYMRMATLLLLVAMHALDHLQLKSAIDLFDYERHQRTCIRCCTSSKWKEHIACGVTTGFPNILRHIA